MPNQIFIIIDPQNDFTAADGNYAKRHQGMKYILDAKKNINRLLASYAPGNFIIVKSDYLPDQFEPGLNICVPGTRGHELDESLNFHKDTPRLTKTRHSAFSAPNFQHHLESKQTDNLLLCGFLAEYCVRKTALDALGIGYHVHLIQDCIATGDDVQHRKADMLDELQKRGARITNADDYL